MIYHDFSPTVYDYPEHDRTDRNHEPEFFIPGEDDPWADHTRSCSHTMVETERGPKMVAVLPIRREEPTDHNDLETVGFDGRDLEAERKQLDSEAAEAAKIEPPPLDEEQTRAAIEKHNSRHTPTIAVNRRTDQYDIYIGRGGPWGNPFPMRSQSTDERRRVIVAYGKWLLSQPAMVAKAHTLYGKRLACYCAPLPCHGDLLACVAILSRIEHLERLELTTGGTYTDLPALRADYAAHPWHAWIEKHRAAPQEAAA